MYLSGGAQYDGDLKLFNSLEETAKKQKKGIWSQNENKIQLPSEYKKEILISEDKKKSKYKNKGNNYNNKNDNKNEKKNDKNKQKMKPSKRGIKRYEEVTVDAK